MRRFFWRRGWNSNIIPSMGARELKTKCPSIREGHLSAERAGFEPANLCGLHAFQACALSQTTRPLHFQRANYTMCYSGGNKLSALSAQRKPRLSPAESGSCLYRRKVVMSVVLASYAPPRSDRSVPISAPFGFS